MKRIIELLVLAGVALVTQPVWAEVRVFACEPEWGALVTELAGEQAQLFVATTALQDPHHIEARPSLIAKMRNADLLVCTGLELETGWLPILLQRSANAKVQPGQPGYLEVGTLVPRLEIPQRLDRSDGDVHALGNPHIQQDPRNIQLAADELLQRLVQLDAEHADYYRTRYQSFSQRWAQAQQRWLQQASSLKNTLVVSHHNDMIYLLNWLGIRQLGTLEAKPGVEPSPAHLSELLQQLQQTPARLVLRTPYQSAKASEWLAAQTKIRAVALPFTVGAEAPDLFALFDLSLQRLLGQTP